MKTKRAAAKAAALFVFMEEKIQPHPNYPHRRSPIKQTSSAQRPHQPHNNDRIPFSVLLQQTSFKAYQVPT